MPGLKARPLELSAFQPVSQLHGPRFQKCIRMRRPCVYNLPDETGPALCPKMDGIIRVCATACSSPPPGAPPVGISIQIRNVATKYRPTWISFENGDKSGQFLPFSDNRVASPRIPFLQFSSLLPFSRSHRRSILQDKKKNLGEYFSRDFSLSPLFFKRRTIKQTFRPFREW